MSELFGTLSTDKNLEKIMQCREIVKTIVAFGVTQEQILLIIQGLGYELENHEHLIEVVGLTKELLASSNLTLVGKNENG